MIINGEKSEIPVWVDRILDTGNIDVQRFAEKTLLLRNLKKRQAH